jgi:hypothetical protein
MTDDLEADYDHFIAAGTTPELEGTGQWHSLYRAGEVLTVAPPDVVASVPRTQSPLRTRLRWLRPAAPSQSTSRSRPFARRIGSKRRCRIRRR